MKKILAILILIFSLQTPSQADDIRDFQIEGISIGDSLLDYFSKKEIENNRIEFTSNNRKYSYTEIFGGFNEFENIQFMYKKNDKKYRIASINGVLFFKNNLKKCLSKKDTIVKSVNSIISQDTKINNTDAYPHSKKFSKSMVYTSEFNFKNGDQIRVYCINWTKKIENKKGWSDHLGLNITTNEFFYWLNNEAYK